MRKKENLYAPNYERGIFRLFPTLLSHSFGKTLPKPYRKWVMKNAEYTQQCDIAIILLIDALGAKQYKGEPLRTLWRRGGKKQLSSVFPTSTSNALASLFLGTPPEENGLVAVRFYVNAIGNFINSLKASVLGKEEDSLSNAGVNPRSFLWKAPLMDTMADNVKIVNILDKHYAGGLSRFFGKKGEDILIGNEIDMFSTTLKAVKEVSEKHLQSVFFLYTPLLDTLGHAYGPNSTEWKQGADFINKQLSHFIKILDRLSEKHKKKIGLFITADHGMTEIRDLLELERKQLEDVRHNEYIKGIMRSARTSFSHLTGRSVEKAKERIAATFQGKYSPYRVEEVANLLWPALTTNVEQFKERIGSLALLPDTHTEFRTTQDQGLFADIGWGRIPFKGSHGGATKEEMEVPLIYTYFG